MSLVRRASRGVWRTLWTSTPTGVCRRMSRCMTEAALPFGSCDVCCPAFTASAGGGFFMARRRVVTGQCTTISELIAVEIVVI